MNLSFAAIADAIRTSLGPRGMDKMVGIPSISANNGIFVLSNLRMAGCVLIIGS